MTYLTDETHIHMPQKHGLGMYKQQCLFTDIGLGGGEHHYDLRGWDIIPGYRLIKQMKHPYYSSY